MKRTAPWWALTACSCFLAVAGDWLSIGGDPQHSGWQRRGKQLTTANVKDLKLLWKRQPGGQSGELTEPVIAGPTITHRGVRELLFIGGTSDNVYAIDADLGTLFWTRQLESSPPSNTKPHTPCGSELMATPVIQPDARASQREDDEPGPMRPIYVVASDGMLHKIRPSDGADMSPPVPFLPPHAFASSLNFAGNFVYAATSKGCGDAPNGVWAIDTRAPHAKANFYAADGGGASPQVSIGTSGNVYFASKDKLVTLAPGTLELMHTIRSTEPLSVTPVPFPWQRGELLVTGGRRGLLLLDGANLEGVAATELTGRVATWQDPAGTRWIYAAAPHKIAAFRLVDAKPHPKLEPAWEATALAEPGPPVVTNGVVFSLAGEANLVTLFALDAVTGGVLYSHATSVSRPIHSRELSVANGHVCFAAPDATVHCFGIPIE